jgi:hypothetical protein
MIARKFRAALRTSLAPLIVLSIAGPVQAAESPVVLSSEPIKLDKVTILGGKATHAVVDPAVTHDQVTPGSHLVVITDYRSTSDKPLDHFVDAAVLGGTTLASVFVLGLTFGPVAREVVTHLLKHFEKNCVGGGGHSRPPQCVGAKKAGRHADLHQVGVVEAAGCRANGIRRRLLTLK